MMGNDKSKGIGTSPWMVFIHSDMSGISPVMSSQAGVASVYLFPEQIFLKGKSPKIFVMLQY